MPTIENQVTELNVPQREWKVPLFLLLIALVCVAWGIHTFVRDSRAHDSWPAIQAQVARVRNGRYTFYFRFHYAVGGVSFLEESYNPFQVYATPTTTVYYNPADPSDFVPCKAMYYDTGLAVICGFGCLVAAWLRHQNSEF